MKASAANSVATYCFAAAVLSIVGILIVPLPPPLLDALLAIDLLFAGTVLLISIVISDPLEFAAFAPVLLVATLFRLALDVSATRLILTRGHVNNGVGDLIPAFGEFVVRGNLVVGIVIFIILITIQFVVIASGAGRVAEVAARFTLDAMPGKQMAIDAELHAGAIDAATAKRRRATVQREADFFGAMDGAGKFVKGDAVAALAIVALNILGGVLVGVCFDGMDIVTALSTFALLSIGNALLTTLPSFLLSTSMGLLVTRAAADGSLGADLAAQLLRRPEIVRISGGFAFMLAIVPVLPHALFVVLGIAAFGIAELAAASNRKSEAVRSAEREHAKRSAGRRPETALARLGVDAVAIDFGSDLLSLCSGAVCDALIERIGEVRRALATEIGVVLPGVRLRDDLSGDSRAYTIRIRDEVVGGGRLRLDSLLAVADERVLTALNGDATRDPVYGITAKWIDPAQRDAAVTAGALVFDPISILGSHLAESVRRNAARLLGRQELQTVIEHLRSSVPTLVKDLGGDRLSIPALQRILQALLRERVWPRDPVLTFETIVDAANDGIGERGIIERVRGVLVPAQLRRRNMAALTPFMLDPEFESELVTAFASPTGAADPRRLLPMRDAIERYARETTLSRAALVCTAALRADLADFMRRVRVEVPVYAFNEIPHELELKPVVLFAPGRELAGAR